MIEICARSEPWTQLLDNSTLVLQILQLKLMHPCVTPLQGERGKRFSAILVNYHICTVRFLPERWKNMHIYLCIFPTTHSFAQGCKYIPL